MESLLFIMFTLFSRDFSEGELHRTEIMIKIKGRWFSLFVSLCFSKLFHRSFTYFLVCIHVLIGLTSVVSKQRHQFLSVSVYTLFYLFSLKTQQCIQKKNLYNHQCALSTSSSASPSSSYSKTKRCFTRSLIYPQLKQEI